VASSSAIRKAPRVGETVRSGGCGDARSARAAYRRVRGEPRARASTGTPRARFSRRVARYASRDARRGARASEPRDVPLSGRRSSGWEDAPNFVRLALGLRAFDEPVGVRGDHGARYERGRVLHDRGSRRGALGRPRARLADGRHGVTGGARAGSVVRGFAEHGREVCGARVRAYLSTARRRGLSGVRCLTRSVSNVRTVRARAVRSTRDADLARGKHKGKLRLFTGFSHSTGQICPVLVCDSRISAIRPLWARFRRNKNARPGPSRNRRNRRNRVFIAKAESND
jgi:hypothetical protein